MQTRCTKTCAPFLSTKTTAFVDTVRTIVIDNVFEGTGSKVLLLVMVIDKKKILSRQGVLS